MNGLIARDFKWYLCFGCYLARWMNCIWIWDLSESVSISVFQMPHPCYVSTISMVGLWVSTILEIIPDRFVHTEVTFGKGQVKEERFIFLRIFPDDKYGGQWLPTGISKACHVGECIHTLQQHNTLPSLYLQNDTYFMHKKLPVGKEIM